MVLRSVLSVYWLHCRTPGIFSNGLSSTAIIRRIRLTDNVNTNTLRLDLNLLSIELTAATVRRNPWIVLPVLTLTRMWGELSRGKNAGIKKPLPSIVKSMSWGQGHYFLNQTWYRIGNYLWMMLANNPVRVVDEAIFHPFLAPSHPHLVLLDGNDIILHNCGVPAHLLLVLFET